jgi:hypothetical protein
VMTAQFHHLPSCVARAVLGVLAFATVACVSSVSNAQSNTVGQWSSVMTTPYEGVHLIMLPTGQVMMWSHFADSLLPQL